MVVLDSDIKIDNLQNSKEIIKTRGVLCYRVNNEREIYFFF